EAPSFQELSQLDPILGQFTCTGVTYALPADLQTAHPIKATLRFERDLKGTWIHGRYTEKKTAANTDPCTNELFMTVDPVTGVFRHTYFGPKGDEGLYESHGVDKDGVSEWKGSIQVLGQNAPSKEAIFAKDGKVRFHADLSFDKGVTYIPVYDIDCIKN